MSAADTSRASDRERERNTVIIPILDAKSREQLHIDRRDVDERLLKFMSGHDVPLASWLDCCMVALERQDEDLCRLFAKNAARVALSESSRGSRDRSDRSDRYDDHTHLRVKTVRLWVGEAVTLLFVFARSRDVSWALYMMYRSSFDM